MQQLWREIEAPVRFEYDDVQNAIHDSVVFDYDEECGDVPGSLSSSEDEFIADDDANEEQQRFVSNNDWHLAHRGNDSRPHEVPEYLCATWIDLIFIFVRVSKKMFVFYETLFDSRHI